MIKFGNSGVITEAGRNQVWAVEVARDITVSRGFVEQVQGAKGHAPVRHMTKATRE